ncbi:MAG: NAD(P)-dependent oxidoreductase [Candidatus Yanofskybacteria bacterium]|nr:NAD(P)-dependent oxidoreductase [Candidatus Yanofskybacteria bacterium]
MLFKNKNVLVAGGTGLVGRFLVKLLIEQGANVRIASMDDPSRAHPQAEFKKTDLTNYDNCLAVCKDMNYVFNLLCAKGSPDTVRKYPATLMRPMILFNTHLFDAALQSKVGGFLYTSSVGVYYPASVYHENDTERTPPPPNDFAGRAKLFGEWYATALRIEHNWDVSIVRPANVYGPYDNFDSINAMVVPSLIKRALTEDPMTVWGDGSSVRDFIHAEDVARGMLCVSEKKPNQPVNLGSGVGVSIRELVETIASNIQPAPKVVWDTSKPSGDAQRILSTSRAQELGFRPTISLKQGIGETIRWYEANRNATDNRYDIFKQIKP